MLGPDGFSPHFFFFFQRHWEIVGESVTNVCPDILNNKYDFSCVNHTFIALILRITSPKKMNEFLLAFAISCTKLFANRMSRLFILEGSLSRSVKVPLS